MFTIFLSLAIAASAQSSSKVSGKNSGLYEYTSFTGGHDSAASWNSEMDSAVGYDINSAFAVEAGAPFYLLTSAPATTTTGTQTSTTHNGSLGDAFFRLKGQKKSDAANYATSFTITAPTGDTSTGASTGRATFGWNNRLEHGFEHVTPFGEASLGNSLASTRRIRRDYTTLGAVSEFRGGVGFDLLKNLSLEASGYKDVGYGNQKIYSRSIRKGSNGLGSLKHNRTFDLAYLTAGSGSLVDDGGLTGDLCWTMTPRFDMDLAYNHSLHFVTNSVAVTIGLRLGHLNDDKSVDKN